MAIKEGDKIPSMKLKRMTANGPADISTDEIFAGKKVALFSVPGVIADPRLDLYRGTTFIQGNNDWGGDPSLSAAFTQVGAFALPSATSKDAALLVTLPPGSYSAQVSGVNGATGVALVEVYEVP